MTTATGRTATDRVYYSWTGKGGLKYAILLKKDVYDGVATTLGFEGAGTETAPEHHTVKSIKEAVSAGLLWPIIASSRSATTKKSRNTLLMVVTSKFEESIPVLPGKTLAGDYKISTVGPSPEANHHLLILFRIASLSIIQSIKTLET